MRITLAQLNPTVGAIEANAAGLRAAYRDALSAGADLVLTGELGLTGYPPEDLVLKPSFVHRVADALEGLADDTTDVPLVVGFVEDLGTTAEVDRDAVLSEDETARTLANSAAVLRGGAIAAVYRKQRIPNYGVFDEARYFQAGREPLVVEVGGRRIGVTVCEDLWVTDGPMAQAAAAGAEVLLSLNASPFQRGKIADRSRWAAHHARSWGTWVAYCNLVGGQDEVVFDGNSFVMSPDGTIVARAAGFAPDICLVDLDDPDPALADRPRDDLADVYDALVLGVRDYFAKNGFARAIVGVSGGIDSALTAAIAADALGPAQLTCVAMPSPHSSQGSLDDARSLSEALGAAHQVIEIAPMMTAFDGALATSFAGTEPGIAEENLQSRIRGTLLMALSNKHGGLVLATGNKSEYAVGYATLYGDMAGGLAVLKDVDKTNVYALSVLRNTTHHGHWRGPAGAVIPQPTIDKPPSAELRPGQVDTDSLPPYDVLDPILAGYVERTASVEDLVAAGHDEATVLEVARLVDGAEYKRRQSPPGVKVTPRAFGRDRRLPITQRWWG